MKYITFDEFTVLNGRDLDKETFDKLLPKATAILDNITSNYYKNNSIDKDHEWRVTQFKHALCSQIEYFHVLGATTFEEINNSPQTFSAGRTSVSNASRYNPSGANESKPLVSEDVFIYLDGTGLLYKGVMTW